VVLQLELTLQSKVVYLVGEKGDAVVRREVVAFGRGPFECVAMAVPPQALTESLFTASSSVCPRAYVARKARAGVKDGIG
jgi:hypothetical protein